MRRKRLLYVTTGLTTGGAETQVVALACGMAKRGWDVGIVSMLPPERFEDELHDAGVSVFSLGMTRGRATVRDLLAYVRCVNAFRPDVVHSHMVHANLLARLGRLAVRVPVLVSTAHSLHEGGRMRDLAYRATDSLADVSTNVCQRGLARYLEVGAISRQKGVCIPNGISVHSFTRDEAAGAAWRRDNGFSKDDFLWIAVGRLDPAKDYPNLLTAFGNVIASRPDARLAIAGEGPERPSLERAIGACHSVRLLGLLKNTRELYSAADALVLSSAWEGLPLVLLEAAAAELPLVATDVGGAEEIVENGRTGWLVPPKAPQLLAEQMLRMMSTPAEWRREMGRLGRVHVLREFQIDSIVLRWIDLYGERLRARQHTC